MVVAFAIEPILANILREETGVVLTTADKFAPDPPVVVTPTDGADE
jgi:hypothetical protein